MRRSLFIVAAVAVLVGCGGEPTGLWQGEPAAADQPHAQPTSRWLVIDTGGSGGGFGHGDIRQKLHDVHFWDNQIGWACGYGGVFRTADGGLTWARVRPKRGWYHVEMTSPDNVWLLEGFHGKGKAKLWHTADNGDTWTEVAPDTFRGYHDFYCRFGQGWILAGGYPSYRSRDGGHTWERVHIGGGLEHPFALAIPGDIGGPHGYTIYVLGQRQGRAHLVKSTDGGDTWTDTGLPAIGAHHRANVYFATSRRGWVSGLQGALATTEDGGDTWTRVDLPTDQQVSALWLDARGHGFAGASNANFHHPREALYETVDGGRTWVPVFGGRKHVAALFGRGPHTVWAVGDVPGYIPNDLVAILERPPR